MLYIRYALSLRQVEDVLFERGIDICHETVRLWWNRFSPLFAAEIRKYRGHGATFSRWRWYLDEVFVRVNGETHDLWRAVNHDARCSRFCHEASGPQGSTEASETDVEALRPAKDYRNGPGSLLCRRDERDWHAGASGLWKSAQQSS